LVVSFEEAYLAETGTSRAVLFCFLFCLVSTIHHHEGKTKKVLLK